MLPRFDIFLGLVVKHQLVVLDCTPHAGFKHQVLDRLNSEFPGVEYEIIAAFFLGEIHGRVRRSWSGIPRPARRTKQRNSYVRRHPALLAVNRQWLDDAGQYLLRRRRDLPRVRDVAQQNDELVAPDARNDIVLPHALLEAVGNFDEESIPRGVAERIR